MKVLSFLHLIIRPGRVPFSLQDNSGHENLQFHLLWVMTRNVLRVWAPCWSGSLQRAPCFPMWLTGKGLQSATTRWKQLWEFADYDLYYFTHLWHIFHISLRKTTRRQCLLDWMNALVCNNQNGPESDFSYPPYQLSPASSYRLFLFKGHRSVRSYSSLLARNQM